MALAADETELREFLERSRPGAGSAGVPMLPWRGDEVSPTAEASRLRPLREAGILVLSPRGHARYALEQLTDREQDVLALMAEGRSNSGIASQLYVTEHTVEKHVKNIFAALRLSPSPGDHRRVLAVLIYLRAVAAG
jgi:DNA-binding NarL/FixJ family response regulator